MPIGTANGGRIAASSRNRPSRCPRGCRDPDYWLVDLRRRLGWSQQKTALELGISGGHIVAIETGRRSLRGRDRWYIERTLERKLKEAAE